MFASYFKWTVVSIYLIIQVSVLVQSQECPCSEESKKCNYRNIYVDSIKEILITDSSVYLPLKFECADGCRAEEQCLRVQYESVNSSKIKSCSEEEEECATVLLLEKTPWWYHLDNLCPDTDYLFTVEAIIEVPPISLYQECFDSLSVECLKKNWVKLADCEKECCLRYEEECKPHKDSNMCSENCKLMCVDCQRIGNATEDSCRNVTFTIQTKPKRLLGCYSNDSPRNPMFPGGVTVASHGIHFSTQGGKLCGNVTISETPRISLESSASTNDVCQVSTSFDLDESCEYVVENLCPNTKYNVSFNLDSVFEASFCTLPSEPSAPGNFKIERVFETNSSYHYELTWSKPKNFLPDLQPYYRLNWYKNDAKLEMRAPLGAFNLTDEKYVIDHLNLESKNKYNFEVQAVYQEPHHDDKVIGMKSTLEAVFDIKSSAEVNLQMARIEDKITAVLTWPRAKSDTKFVQYSLQLHLLERDACLSSDFDRYIRRIQNEINMVEVETLDANWEVEKDQCYVASVDTIYEDGPTFAFSNFLYTAIPPPKKETDLGLILGSVFGSLFFLALVAGLFLFWRRRKRSLDAKCQPKQGVRNKAFTKEADPETFELPQRNSEHEIPTTTFCNVISERVSDVHEKSLKSEFESLKKKSNALARIHDHTSGTKTSKVYGIKGSNMGKDYLVSKSPALQETENLFWKQIMENSVRFIVMLTLHHEHGEVFCSDYLPKDKEPHDFGEIKFKIESKSDGSGYVRREIALQAGNHRQKVTHFQFVNWSKNYCPDISLILNFIRTLRDERAKVENSGSLFVHCSQDFGRTATFIALDKTLQDIEKNKSTLNVFNYVLELRRNLKHLGLLHNERQYIFIHECIMQYLRTPDIYNGYVELEDPANARNNASAAGATTAIDGEPIYADVEITKPDVTAPQMPRPRMGLPPTPNRDSGGHYEVL